MAQRLKVRPEFFSVGRPLARIDTVQRALPQPAVGARQRPPEGAGHGDAGMGADVRPRALRQAARCRPPESSPPARRRRWPPLRSASTGPCRTGRSSTWSPRRSLAASSSRCALFGEIDAVDAFSVVIVDRPIIITTPRRSENVFRHRFSIAHEIGHLLLHRDAGEHSAAIEKEADEFAAAFLTPAAAMDAALPQRLDLAALDRLGRTWGVSPHSLVRRMVERGRTTESSARRAYQRLAMPLTIRWLTRRAPTRGRCRRC